MSKSPFPAAGEAVPGNRHHSPRIGSRRRSAVPKNVPLDGYSICDLTYIMQAYDRLADMIDREADERPFVMGSATTLGCVDLTPAGAPLGAFADWLRKQRTRMVDELRQSQPVDDWDIEERAGALCRYLTDLNEIAAIASEAARALAMPGSSAV